MQRQLEQEIGPAHPLHASRPVVIGRRIDCDDVVVRLNDGTYANVHLVWGSGPGAFPAEYPSWFAYGSEAAFLAAMRADATEYNSD